ncbi:hypothetical protein ACFO0S_09130 [Chryseomicrobium palamuruense]|uniref:DUF4233 domain-containing protein n=1 Tax=Chryseomicrobium palamuruense TaxID=682973 RepID=A0ABV8UV60_9BACL
MSNLRVAKIIALIFEVVLAIPILGGSIVIMSGYSALGVAFIIHLVVFILALKMHGAKLGSIFGMVTSLIAWIPGIGWLFHTITAIVYAVEVLTRKE